MKVSESCRESYVKGYGKGNDEKLSDIPVVFPVFPIGIIFQLHIMPGVKCLVSVHLKVVKKHKPS